jgi:hypothetical protein
VLTLRLLQPRQRIREMGQHGTTRDAHLRRGMIDGGAHTTARRRIA